MDLMLVPSAGVVMPVAVTTTLNFLMNQNLTTYLHLIGYY
jgi:hypothetical protein